MDSRDLRDYLELGFWVLVFGILLLVALGKFPLPDFGAVKVQTLDGNKVDLESLYDYRSAISIVVYVSRSCRYCKDMIPTLNELDAVEDIQVIAIFPDKEARAVEQYVKDNEIQYLVVHGRGTPQGYPFTVFMAQTLEGDWVEAYQKVGWWDLNWFARLVSGGQQ